MTKRSVEAASRGQLGTRRVGVRASACNPLAAAALRLPQTAVQRLRRGADLDCVRAHRRPFRTVLALTLEHAPPALKNPANSVAVQGQTSLGFSRGGALGKHRPMAVLSLKELGCRIGEPPGTRPKDVTHDVRVLSAPEATRFFWPLLKPRSNE